VQQGSPALPQGTHWLLVSQRVSGAVQPMPAQQGWPMPPQVPFEQLPFAHIAVMQRVLLAWQAPETQQPPSLQALAPQQGWPGAPHGPQVPAPKPRVQTVPGAEQKLG